MLRLEDVEVQSNKGKVRVVPLIVSFSGLGGWGLGLVMTYVVTKSDLLCHGV